MKKIITALTLATLATGCTFNAGMNEKTSKEYMTEHQNTRRTNSALNMIDFRADKVDERFTDIEKLYNEERAEFKKKQRKDKEAFKAYQESRLDDYSEYQKTELAKRIKRRMDYEINLDMHK